MNIKETALKVWDSNMIECPPENLTKFAEALVAELAKENKPVAWMYEYSYDLNGDKQGHWPVEMYTHVSFSRSKPSVESTPLYTLPPTAEQIEQETAEAIAKMLDDKDVGRTDYCMHVYEEGEQYKSEAIAAVRNGAWKECK